MLSSSQDLSKYKDYLEKLGSADALTSQRNLDVSPVIERITEKELSDELGARKGRFEELRLAINNGKTKVDKLRERISVLAEKIENLPKGNLFKGMIFYLLPGFIYLAGDIMFSKELIVQGWGLGLANPIETWILALAVGLAPFVIKHIVDRFLEPNLETGSKILRCLVGGVYISLGILVVLAFLQIGYLRGIIFKFTKISYVGNVYDLMFQQHSSAMIAAFVLVAFMFVIGGGILLSVGMREVTRWRESRELRRQQRKYQEDLSRMELTLQEELAELAQIKMIDSMTVNLDKVRGSMVSELSYYYDRAFEKSLSTVRKAKEKEADIDPTVEYDDNFHHYVRRILDESCKNGVPDYEKQVYE